MKVLHVAVLLSSVALLSACTKQPGGGKPAAPRVLVDLPLDCHTPDGCTLMGGGDIILSIPNFNNQALIDAKVIEKDAPACMVKIDKENKLTRWYDFRPEDLHPVTGKVGPMGCDVGPDGHLYVADNQFFSDPAHKSRLLRIRIEDGKAVGCDTVVEGFIVSNAVIWKGDTVYVSETILAVPPAAEEGAAPSPLTSGVYAIPMSEWKDGPVKLQPWSPESADPHLIATYTTSGKVGFGADGLTFDGDGNLYCGIFEDGIIYKTTFGDDGKVKETKEFARSDAMACCDGIFWSSADGKIYVADMLKNAVRAVDAKGQVTTVHENGDTDGADGSFDQPCEVLVRGDELIVINMDMVFPSDLLTNTKIDKPFTVSAIALPAKE